MPSRSVLNSLLALILRDGLDPSLAGMVAVDLVRGPLPQGAGEAGPHVYFPEDALVGLGHMGPMQMQAPVAVVGRHACVGLAELWGLRMQAHVLVPGRAWRLDWQHIQHDPELHAKCLWHISASAQGLIRQMAQMAFCARHHDATQRLANWLLVCQGQFAAPGLTLVQADLPDWLCQAGLSDGLQGLQACGAIALQGQTIEALDEGRLKALACRCHEALQPTVQPTLQPPLT